MTTKTTTARTHGEKARAPRTKKAAAARPTMEVDLTPTDHDVPLLGGPGAGMAHVLDVPIADLTAHPDNVRHDVDDLDEMAESIRSLGILQRLVVAPTPPGADGQPIASTPFVVIAGHRRLAAAALADVPVVPVEIRYDLDSLQLQVEAMLVENIHRKDLTAVEEGEAYQTLLDLGTLDEDGIAHATGRSLATVRRRVRLANAPVAIRNAVHAGMATLADADKLDDLLDEPDLLDQVVQFLGTRDFAWRLQDALNTRRGRLDDRANDEAYRAAGLRVLGDSELPAGWASWNSMAPVPVDRMPAYYQAEPDQRAQLVADHAKDCPHAVWVWPKAVHGCMAPDAHRPTVSDPTLPGTGTADTGPATPTAEDYDARVIRAEEEARDAERAAWLEAAAAHVEVRNAYVTELLTQGINPKHTAFVFAALARLAATSTVELDLKATFDLARALGADPALVDVVQAGDDWDDAMALAAQTVAAAKPAATALAVLWHSSPDKNPYGWQRQRPLGEDDVAWLRLLEDLGHALSTWETEQLTAAEQELADATTARRDRWTAALADTSTDAS